MPNPSTAQGTTANEVTSRNPIEQGIDEELEEAARVVTDEMKATQKAMIDSLDLTK